MRFVCVFALCFLHLSCGSRNSKYDYLNSLSCDSVLHLIVLATDIDSSLKNKEVLEDRIINDTVVVKIYHRNEAEPGAFVQATDCFLLLDLRTLKAYKWVVEIDSNIEVNSNKELIKCYKDKCKS